MQTIVGWLFGLKAPNSSRLSVGNVTLRQMSDAERNRILDSSQDFFAKDPRIWTNCTDSFPLVFEKRVSAECPIGGDDSVAVVLSLLAPGEVRTPVVWSTNEDGGATSASSSQVIDCLYRLINGRFQTVEFEAIRQSAQSAFERLQFFLGSSAYQLLDTVLLDRLFESKEHTLHEGSPAPEVIARAADVCIGLESLYAEGAGEVQFKLAISIAWLLESDPRKRDALMNAVKDTYALRSRSVHGGTAPAKPLSKEALRSVVCADQLLRRSILTMLLNKMDETQWKNTFKQARIGLHTQLDTADWIQQ